MGNVIDNGPDTPPTVISTVKDVKVTGFRVEGFPGTGIQLAGAERTTLANDVAVDNGSYGFFALFSTRTSLVGDTASGSGEAGIYIGDSPNALATVAGNESHDNSIGIFVRDAIGGKIVGNSVHDNCSGILFLADAPGPVGGFQVSGNSVRHNNRYCPDLGGGAVSGEGIDLLGAANVTVSANQVFDNAPSGPASPMSSIGGGIQVVAAGPGGSAPSNDSIVGNIIRRNKPQDLIWDGSGTGNRFIGNICNSSDPSGLCS